MTDTDVFEQTVDIGHVAQERNTLFSPTFAHSLDAAHQDGSTVGDADDGIDGREGDDRQLNRDTLSCGLDFFVTGVTTVAVDCIEEVVQNRIGRSFGCRATRQR